MAHYITYPLDFRARMCVECDWSAGDPVHYGEVKWRVCPKCKNAHHRRTHPLTLPTVAMIVISVGLACYIARNLL